MSDIPSRLLEQFSGGGGSIFVGGSIPAGLGAPGWAELVQHLRGKIPRCPASAHFLDVAQYFEDEFGREALDDEIRRVFGSTPLEPTALHRQLVKIPKVRRIFTTSLSDQLEQAARMSRCAYNRITNRSAVGLDPDKLNIIKLRGDINDSKSYVVTSADYESYAASYPEIVNLITYDCQRGTVLFVGYSFTDLDLRFILRQAIDQTGHKRSHYFLQVNPTRAVLKAIDRRGLHAISVVTGDGEEAAAQALGEWLRGFRHAIAKTTSPGHCLVHRPPSATGTELFGREKDIQRVIKAVCQSANRAVLILGPAGIGKTSVAEEVRRRLSDADGSGRGSRFASIVWFSAANPRGKWLDDLVTAILVALSPSGAPDSREERLTQANDLLALSPVLIVIDNLESIDDRRAAAWIDNLPPATKVLITTREAGRAQIRDARRIDLKGLELSEALDLARDEARKLGLIDLTKRPSSEFRRLIESTGGSPQVIKLTVGQAKRKRSPAMPEATASTPGDIPAHSGAAPTALDAILRTSWTLLSENARKVLMAAPLFFGVSSLRYDGLREVTGLEHEAMHAAFRELVDLKLIEVDFRTSRYVVHPSMAFAGQLLRQDLDQYRVWKNRCIAYLEELVRRNIRRERPPVRYWNALVSDSMCNIDPDWPSIHQALKWLDQEDRHDELTVFLMWLIHYMNSRFYNSERLAYTNKVLAHLKASGRVEEEALLRIDALGWTYLEEKQLDEARREIAEGIAIAAGLQGSERQDLLALGYAWRARICIEQGHVADANGFISDARRYPCNPWIAFRVSMAAGDVAIKQNDYTKALELYMDANDQAGLYSGEGHGYQIEPRLGIACVALGRLDEASDHFERLGAREQLPISKMYSDYGMALIALRQGDSERARKLEEPVKAKLDRTNSGLLFTLLSDLYMQLKRSEARRVFVSYSQKDSRYVDELLTHLKPLQRSGIVSSWSDRQLKAGSDWMRDIKLALSESAVAVMLVSPDFLASDFIHSNELLPILHSAEARGLRVLWVNVRDSLYMETPLKDFQAAFPTSKAMARMSAAERSKAWVHVCTEIINALQ